MVTEKSGETIFWVRCFFRPSSFSGHILYGSNKFVFFINPYSFLTFVNGEGPCLAEGFLHTLCPCSNIVFAQLGVIPRTRKKLVETVAVAERYLIITQVKNKESKKQSFRICLPVNLVDEECQ